MHHPGPAEESRQYPELKQQKTDMSTSEGKEINQTHQQATESGPEKAEV